MKKIIRKTQSIEGFKVKDYYLYINDVVLIHRFLLIPNDKVSIPSKTQHFPVRIMKNHTLWFKSFSVKKETLLQILKGF